jgi:hypothetical protein
VENLATNPGSPSGGPITGDGNGDGIPDSQQANVTSLPGITGKWITLAVSNNLSLQNVTPKNPPYSTTPPSGYLLPLGFVSFTVGGISPGGTITITNFLHDNDSINTVLVYGPTLDNPQPHWYELSITGGINEFHLTLTDGGSADQDLQTNGVVAMFWAPAYPLPPGPPISALGTTLSYANQIDIILQTNAPLVVVTNSVRSVTSVLAWPAASAQYIMKYTDQLSLNPIWHSLDEPATLISGQLVLTNVSTTPTRFYRMEYFP